MFNKLFEKFTDYLISKEYSNSTINSYLINVRGFLDYLNEKKYKEINQNVFNEYFNILNKSNLSPQTINSKIFSVKKFLEFIKHKGKINFDLDFRLKKVTKKDFKRIDICDLTKEIDLSNSVCKNRDRLFFVLQYYTGSKTKDLLKIKVSDIDFDKSAINVAVDLLKVGTTILKTAKEYIKKEKMNNGNYLFYSFHSRKKNLNKHLTEKSIQEMFRKYTSNMGCEYSIIDLRNSYKSNIYINAVENSNFENVFAHSLLNTENDFLTYYRNNFG